MNHQSGTKRMPIPGRLAAGGAEGWVPLVARHEIVHLPSASVLVLLRRELPGPG